MHGVYVWVRVSVHVRVCAGAAGVCVNMESMCAVGRLVGWLVGWLVAGWLVGQLVD